MRLVIIFTSYARIIAAKRHGDILDAVRHQYLQRYTNAQMIIPEEVFAAAIYANNGLSRLYGMLRRLDGLTIIYLNFRTTAEDGQEKTINSAFSYLKIFEDVSRNCAKRSIQLGHQSHSRT
jgi:hypothetical protein